jgi:hypothetical protein
MASQYLAGHWAFTNGQIASLARWRGDLLVYNGYYLEEGALFLNTALERLSTVWPDGRNEA